jgi:hypothetical protein
MRLYEQLLQEAAQEKEKETADREKHQKMRAYIRRHSRSTVTGGGYVISEEIQEGEQRHLAHLQVLCDFLIWGVKGLAGSYRMAHLRRKYPVEYAHLRDIEISSE